MPASLRLCLALVTLLSAGSAAAAYTREDYRADELAMDQYFIAGDYAGAEAAARAMADRAAEAFGPDAPEVLDALTSLANSLRQQDRAGEALTLFQQVHDAWQRTKGDYYPATLRAAMALAIALTEAGAPERALPIALQTVRVAEAVLGPEDPTTLLWRYNVAGIYSDLGYLEEALAAYRATLPAYLAAAQDIRALRHAAVIAREIARTESALGRPDAAADAYAEAIVLVERAYGPRHPELAETMNEYGLELWRSGRRDDLPAFIEEAAALTRDAFGPRSFAMSEVMALQVLVASQGGPGTPGFDEALALQRQVVALRSELLSPMARETGRAMLDLAAMLSDTTDPARLREAWEMLRQAQAAGSGSRNFAYGLLFQIRAAQAMPQADLAEAMLWVAQDSQGSAAANASLKYGQRLALGEGEAARTYRAATDLTEREARLQQALLAEADLPLAERDLTREQALRGELAEVTARTDQLWKDLDAAAPGMSDLIGGGRLSLAEVQAALGPDEALVVLDIGTREGDTHVAIAVTREGADFADLRWTTDSFAGAVAEVRDGIALRLGTRAAAALEGEDAPAAGPPFSLEAARWLYAETLGQVEPVFAGKSHLYLDLRGALAALPPHLLLVSDPVSSDLAAADWLIRHQALTVLPSVFSLKTIALARGRAGAPQPLLAFGDPVFDLAEGGALVAALDDQAAGVLRGALAPLPETAGEVRAVAEALGAPPAAVRTGAAATEAALKEAPLRDFRVLHFATHGLVTGDVAGETVLGEPALALTPGRGEDGFLTVSEIIGLDLNADWVVLSACNTAVGNDPDAEALSGLAQAFFYAGARGLLVSHWPVESRSAAQLITETFRTRAATPGLSAAEAQRRAILAMIGAPGGRWSHPAYWAPFVLVGSPD